jgi:anti-sigma B factor antagonist
VETSNNAVTLEWLDGSKLGVRILKVSGPLLISNFFDFQSAARENTPPVLILDLSGVPYMDSAALGSLMGIHVTAERTKRKYGLANICERIMTMLNVSGVTEVLAIFPSVQAAESALTATTAA